MGIKNLLKFLSNFDDIICKPDNDNDYKYEKVAIDISIILYKVVIAIRNSGADLTNKQGDIVSHILGLFNKTIYLLKKNIIPIYVFDGSIPKIKEKIINDRRELKKKAWEKFEKCNNDKEKIKYFKRTVSITKKQMDECKELLDLMGIPYIQAPEEADSQCAYLVKQGIANSVLTEDMDILTFGANKIYRNLGSYKKETLEIKLDTILEKTKLTYEQFIELCILFGCDYCDGIKDISTYKIYEAYIKFNNIPDTLSYLKEKGYRVLKIDDYQIYKDYFILSPHIDINYDIQLKKPDMKKLELLLVNQCGLLKSKIYNKLQFLKKN